MPEYKVSCPSCKTVLKSAQPLPPGKKIKCPKCQQVFMTAPAAPEVAEEIVPAAAVPPRPRRPVREPQEDDTVPLTRRQVPPPDDYEDEPAPPPRRKAPPPDDYEDEPAPPPRRKAARADDYEDEPEPPPRRKGRPVEDEEEAEPPPRRVARADDDYDDEPERPSRRGARAADDYDDDDPKRRPAKKKNLGMIMASVGGGSFVGMFIFMILSFVFAASAVSGQFRNLQNQFPQQKGQFNIDPKEVDDAMKKALENMPKGFDIPKGDKKKAAKPVDSQPLDNNAAPANSAVQAVDAGAKMNKAAYDQIRLGMRLSEIEKQLGPRTLYKPGDMPKVNQSEKERTAFINAYKKLNLMFQWRDGDNQLFIGFVYGEAGQEDLSVFKAFFYAEGGQTRVIYQADRTVAPKGK